MNPVHPVKRMQPNLIHQMPGKASLGIIVETCNQILYDSKYYCHSSTEEVTTSPSNAAYWSAPHPHLAHLPQLPHPLSGHPTNAVGK